MFSHIRRPRLGLSLRIIMALCGFFAASPAGFPQSTSSLTVTVSNQRTNAYLQMARVEIVGANRVENTDTLGVARFTGLAPGDYSVRISYIGLADGIYSVTISAGQAALLSAELATDDIVKLETFFVAAEREGYAASQIRQKNSGNLVNVIATDALGMLAGDNPAELLIRLPGIYSIVGDEGDSASPVIRGMPGEKNAITADGGSIASGIGTSRNPVFTNFVASVYDEIEVTKANRPDQPADSIGGRINFKTRTGLSLKRAGHEFTYFVGGKWLPGIFNYSSRIEHPPLHPNLRLGYVGLYNAFGGKNNLGITANFSYQQNVAQRLDMRSELDYNNPDGTNTPRFSTNLWKLDIAQDRELTIASVRFDYKYSPNSTFTFSYEWKKEDINLDNPNHAGVHAYITINGVYQNYTTEGGSIDPSSTLDFTKVDTASNNRTNIRTLSATTLLFNKTDTLRFAGDHRLGDWKLNYNLNYSVANRKVGGGSENYDNVMISGFQAYVYNIGWTVDRRASKEFPEFTQTDGLSIYDINSYSNANAYGHHGHAKNEISSADINLSRTVSLLGLPVKLSAGGVYSIKLFDENRHATNFYYVGEDGWQGVNPNTGMNDDNIARFHTRMQIDPRMSIGGNLPILDLKAAEASIRANPEQWRVQDYSDARLRLEGMHFIKEKTPAAYVQAETLLGRLGVITGVRVETTKLNSGAWVRMRDRPDLLEYDDKNWITRESAERRVAAEYERVNANNSYTDWFPSMHLRYALGRDTILRASYSTAMGRPYLSTLIPGVTYDSTTMRITFGGPGLLPQYSEAYDVSFEHYYKPMGMFSVGVFRKDLTDFTYWGMVTENDMDANGLVMGMYSLQDYMNIWPGYEFYYCANGGKGKVQGMEISWEHQFTFLPGYFKGLSLSANFTKLQAKGDYGNGSTGTAALTGFIPTTLNIRVQFKLNRLTAFVQYSWLDRFLDTYDENPQRRIVTLERNVFNVGLSLKLGRYANLAVTANNILDEPQRRVHAVTGERLRTNYNSPFVTVGLNGRF